MPGISLTVATPSWFQFRTVVFSHGWFHLPPFEWDEENEVLTAVGLLGGRPATMRIRRVKRGLGVGLERMGRGKAGLEEEAESLVRRMFGLDLDVSEFYRQAGEEYAWAKAKGAGPFLRSASVFEDSVKMLATTNCSWSLTHQMITRLVETLGEPAPFGRRSFPSAEKMAEQPIRFYREKVRVGYRAPFFREFAVRVATGKVDPESWSVFPGPTDELVRAIQCCPGLGKYSAENICKLLGRFDGLGLDSWCLKKFERLRGPVRGDVAKAIERRYRRHGRWRGLALWLDLTRDWHEEDGIADETVHFEKKETRSATRRRRRAGHG